MRRYHHSMMPTPVDVLIIGGGVIGLSCAWRLAQKGAVVTLLEARTCGAGSSNAALGALWPSDALKHNPLQRLHRQSLWQFGEFAEELEQASRMDIEYNRCGRLENILNQHHYQHLCTEITVAEQEWPRVNDNPVLQILSPAEAQPLEPLARFGAHGALLCQASARVSPPRLVQALKRAAQRFGANIYERQRVEALRIETGKRIAAVSSSRRFETDICLVCAGAWTSQLHPLLQQYAPVMPLKGQALLLQLSRPIISRVLKSGSCYLIQQKNSQVILGATTELEAGYDETVTPQAKAQLLAQGSELVPVLQKAEMVRQWAGLRPAPNYRKPILGPIPEADGLWVASGHGKIGIGIAPLMGRLMAEWLVEGQPSADLASFHPQQR